MYPTPLPNIPYQVGATVLTNQALYPHEMLYAHTYRALYPPYYYEVTAVNNAGVQSDATSQVSSTPLFPAIPTGLAVTPGDGQVTLNWTASTGATSYDIYRSNTSGGETGTSTVSPLA